MSLPRVSLPRVSLPRPRRALPREDPVVSLSFDDGPDPRFTPLVLDELEKHSATATFFVTGERAARHPALVRRILDEGHSLGSHSDSHPEPGALGWGIVGDFVRGRRRVERSAARRVPLFRPPKGYLGRRERWAMLAARVRPWLWTIDTLDWQPGIGTDEIVANASGMGAGDVLLLHDAICGPLEPEALDRSATVHAVGPLVELARSRGLEPVPLAAGGVR